MTLRLTPSLSNRFQAFHPREYHRMVKLAAAQDGVSVDEMYRHLGHDKPVWDDERDCSTYLPE